MTDVKEFKASLTVNNKTTATLGSGAELHARFSTNGSGGGVTQYAQLPDKPQINSVTLEGNKTSAELNIHERHDEISSAQILGLFD